jgi:hypothetical protein
VTGADVVVLHLEQVGEVGADLDVDRHRRVLVAVVDHDDVLEPDVAQEALADDPQRRGGVERLRRRHEEELRDEVVHVGAGEEVGRLALHRQVPPRDEARVLGEEPMGRQSRAGLHVAVAVGHHEGVAVQHADR